MRRSYFGIGLLVALGVLSQVACAQKEPGSGKARRANRLAGESSPYLLQHAHNPVDWYPWGPEAFAKAKRGEQADLPLGRLFGVPLVPRHGARELRGPRDRRSC